MDFTKNKGRAVNFEMAISDWGTAGVEKKHFGGTPMYASKLAFRGHQSKDLFAFGRIAMELFFPDSGA